MDKPIEQYGVVEERDLNRLVTTVNQFVRDGWTPLGGISTRRIDKHIVYYMQAIVVKPLDIS